MAKDPAFLFYSQDFFTGSAVLSFEDKGKYIHLLCLMHQQGRLDEKTIWLCVGSVSVSLKSKFLIDENGLWYNKRLEMETEKRNNYTKSRCDNGSKGGRPKKTKNHMVSRRLTVAKPTDNHMGNENNNINTVIIDKVIDNPLNKQIKNNFNTSPTRENFNGLPEIKIGASIELLKITKQVDVTPMQVTRMWEVFKVQNLTGEKYYQNEDAVYSHFINWIKTQNFNNGHETNGASDKSLGAASRRKMQAFRNW